MVCETIEMASKQFRACVDCLRPLSNSLLGENPGRDSLVCSKVHPEMRGFTTEKGFEDFIAYLGGVLTREAAANQKELADFGPAGPDGHGFYYGTTSGRGYIEFYPIGDDKWVIVGFAKFKDPVGPRRCLKQLGFTTGLVGYGKISNFLAL